MRLLYGPAASPFQKKSRWFTVPSNGKEETDLILGSFIGGTVWEDRDRDGIRETGEPRMGGIAVYFLSSGGTPLDLTDTDAQGNYRFEVENSPIYKLRFVLPTGYRFTTPDQGLDDTLDSDANRLTGETPSIPPPFQLFDESGWGAGLVQEGPCFPPDEPIYIYAVRQDVDHNPILDFQDPNQANQVTGYNIYRSSEAGASWPWPMAGSNVKDMDAGTPNLQWTDSSGDVSPTGVWFYKVTAYNAPCDAEGPL